MAATWHVHVALEPISARGFTRRYGLRHATAWALLHRARRALPTMTPRLRSALGRFAHRNGAPTAKRVAVSRDDGALVLITDLDLVCPGGTLAPEAALQLGRLRAWLTTTFCGVTDRYLDNYLAEFAARFRRVLMFEVRPAT